VPALLDRLVPASFGRPYRWLLSSSWVGSIGDGIALAAGPLLVASQTRNAFLVAAAALLQRLPWLLFGLQAGVVADRIDRRLMLMGSETFRAVVVVVLAAGLLIGHVSIGLILLAMLLLGTADVFSNTTAGTLLPMLVVSEDLGRANSRLQGSLVVCQQLIGPPLGAFLFSAGRAWPFVAQAVVVVTAVLLVARIGARRVAPRGAAGRRIRSELGEGLRWLVRHPPVRTLALIILSFNITWGAAWSVLVLYALRHLHMSKLGYGLLTTSSALGGILAILLYSRLERRWPLGNIMRVCLTLEVCTHLCLALATRGWIAILIMFVFGAYTFVWATVSTTVRQRAVPLDLQGRVGSVYLVGLFGGLVLGQAIGGAIAQRWGVVAPFWFAFAGSGLTLALVWRRLGAIAHSVIHAP
jgi:predicted MFS family arabinose efflux permease